jgi:hypothetical protein
MDVNDSLTVVVYNVIVMLKDFKGSLECFLSFLEGVIEKH